ncbi:hypoxanthine phosphoribosyltransferase [Frankia sp. Mgl5]|uniref:hypoxanthine phosphoribosyltransferase n=1 Tax=Frankia sp. Mgl5 TaxID=2933793 RepID=UPI00200F404D|nr:hypoxanthine phosphoribosyltransferase [Frankia sp. Mgl5]MCK9928006.1 hypoxanthine phosphoribosyltransferase [Frankia sp. Mgl5]
MPAPAVAAVRLAVRDAVADVPPGGLVLVACSGGADSLALAAALAFVAPRRALRAGLLTVDHGWDDTSRPRAEEVAASGQLLGLSPVEVLAAPSPRSEGAARDSRRAALLAAGERLGAHAVLLGHTLDDQAETVLLRLARGSGARSLSGMPATDGAIRRPLLRLRRDQTRQACQSLGLEFWDDPTNADPAFARARTRSTVLPVLEAELGPGIAEALARTADLLRADADALEAQAESVYAELAGSSADATGATAPRAPRTPLAAEPGPRVEFDVAALAGLTQALRSRVLRRAALAAGSSASALRADHIWAVEDLVTRWRGQKPVPLPSGVLARRTGGRIALVGPDAPVRPDTPAGAGHPGRPGVVRAPGERGGPTSRAPASGTLTPGTPASGDRGPGDPARNEEDRPVSQAATAKPDHDGTSIPAGGPPRAHPDIDEILVSQDEIAAKIAELAARVDADYAGREILLVGVLKGAVMVMADLSRALSVPITMEFMAVSSYGSTTSSSGVVRILKDLDRSIEGRDVLVVEDIIDSGLTLSWLLRNLRSRGPASLEVLALFRKPEAITVDVDVRYVGFDIPSAFVVGYGLDYAEHYRTLPFVGTLTPEAIARRA